MGILKKLVAEDFGITGHNRWYKAKEHDSLVVDDLRDVFFWNSAGIFGGPVDYLVKVRNMPYYDAINFLRDYTYYKDTLIVDINNQRDNNHIIINPNLINVFHENCITKDTSYWDRRGINEWSIKAFQLGWTGEFFTIPLYKNGIFKNFQLRKDNPKTIRYFYPLGEWYFFNEDVFNLFKLDEIIITEGPVDCIRLFQEGIPCVSHTLGASGWDLRWNLFFDGIKRIYVLYDNDEAGNIGARKLARHLGDWRTKIYTFWDFQKKGYDVIDFFNDGNSVNDLYDLIHNKSKYCFEI